jgi:hypothetical protein
VEEEQQRRLRRPVEVVEHEHEPAGFRRLHQPGGDRFEQAVLFRARVRRDRARQPRNAGGEIRDHPGEFATKSAELRGRRLRRVPVEGFDERLVRHAQGFLAPAVEHERTLGVR